jgi:hypothetical protein
VALVVVTVVDFLVARKLPRSRQLPAWFLSYILFVSIVAGVAVGLLNWNH